MAGTLAPILRSFAAGEITPRAHLRTDLSGYKNGLKICENFFTTSHGPVVRRGGWEYVATIPSPATDGRLFNFDVGVGEAYAIVITNDNTLRVYDDLGEVAQPGGNLISNASFSDGGTDWITVEAGGADVQFAEGFCQLSPSGGQRAAIQQLITTLDGGNEHRIVVGFASSVSELTLRVGTTQGGNEIAEFNINNVSVFEGFFTPGQLTYWLDFSAEPVSDIQVLTATFSNDTTLPPSPVEFTTPWEGLDITQLQADVPSGTFTMYFVTPNVPPQKLVFDREAQVWSFTEVNFTGEPVEWTDENFPGVITFYQGRMWLAATPDEPENFWASRPLQFEDFTQGVAADDAFTFALSQRGRIRWMKGVKNLLIGTSNGEHIISSELGLVQPGDIQAERQSSFGSKIGQSSQLGTQVLYTSPDGRKVREMGFNWTEEGWVSRDLLFFSEHITKGNARAVGNIVWAQNPENHLWIVTLEGGLLAATYEKAYDVVGWHRHPTTGSVQSIVVLSVLGLDRPWILVNRELPGQAAGTLFLEKFDSDQYLDSHTVITHEPAANTVSVPWLANQTVGILADDATHPDISLDGNGDGVINRDASSILVGLKYTSKMVTLPIDAQTEGGGTIKVAFKRWAKLFVSILGSYPPVINGVRQPTRFPSTPMGEIDPPRTEYVETTQLGYDRDASITVEEDLPVALEINGIFGGVTFDDT